MRTSISTLCQHNALGAHMDKSGLIWISSWKIHITSCFLQPLNWNDHSKPAFKSQCLVLFTQAMASASLEPWFPPRSAKTEFELCEPGHMSIGIPSGKLFTKSYGLNDHVQWVKSLFLWPFSIENLQITTEVLPLALLTWRRTSPGDHAGNYVGIWFNG